MSQSSALCHSVQSPVISSHLPHTFSSTLSFRTLSADVLPCHLFLVHSCLCSFFYLDGGVRLVHKELDGRYTEVGIASFFMHPAAAVLTSVLQ